MGWAHIFRPYVIYRKIMSSGSSSRCESSAPFPFCGPQSAQSEGRRLPPTCQRSATCMAQRCPASVLLAMLCMHNRSTQCTRQEQTATQQHVLA